MTRGRRGAAVAAALILIATGLVAWLRWPPTVVTYQVIAADANTAFAISSEPREHGGAWLSRLDAAGEVVWSRELPGEPELQGLRVGDGVVAVRYANHDGARLIGFDFDGDERWDVGLQLEGDGQPGRFVRGRFLEFTGSSGDVLQAVDGATGRITWWAPGVRGDLPWVVGSRLIAGALPIVHSVDLVSGAVTSREVDGDGCVVGDDYITVVGDALVAFRGGVLARPRRLAAFALPRGAPVLVGCGRFGDDLVLLFGGKHLMLAAADLTGRVRHLVELPDSSQFMWLAVAARHPDLASVGGELTRFVPILVEARGRPWRVAVVDLARGAVRYGRELAAKPLIKVFRRDHRWYLHEEGRYLAVIDGATGRIDAAIGAPALDVDPLQIADDRVWLYPRGGRARVNHSPVTVLDAATLDVVDQGDLEVHDATVLVRGELGLP